MPSPSSPVPTNLPDWLTWIEAQHPSEIEMGLSRVHTVADRLGLLDYFQSRSSQALGSKTPNSKTSRSNAIGLTHVVTIAGTNGKGSTAATIERIACLSGRSVGCFSSPHFLRYNERIRINGVEASDESICQAFTEIEAHTKDQPLTYFEYGTLAALQVFRNEGVEWVILEVGLGGRLDAANIIDADIAMITSIGIDHQDWLGDNRELIGAEKAGILRQNQPLVCGELDLPSSVIELIGQFETPLYQRDQAFTLQQESGTNYQWSGKDSAGKEIRLESLPKPMVPQENVASALQAIALLDPSLLNSSVIRAALKDLRMPGRFFEIPNRAAIVDVAHNPQAASYLSNQLRENPVSGKRIAIFAAMADKDLDGIIEALKGDIDYWVLTRLDIPREASEVQLIELFERQGITAYRTMSSVEMALRDVEQMMTEQDQLLVLGSFFTAAAVFNAWEISSLSELLESSADPADLRT